MVPTAGALAGFTGAGFTGAGFTGAGFTGAGFTGVGFTGAGFTGAGFTGAGFTGAGFTGGWFTVGGYTAGWFTGHHVFCKAMGGTTAAMRDREPMTVGMYCRGCGVMQAGGMTPGPFWLTTLKDRTLLDVHGPA
jgi:hypothetical protein